MGKTAAISNLAGALFSSVQARVLGIIFGAPDRDFPITEIIARAGSGSGAVQRELKKLTEAGIVAQKIQGARKLYHANRKSPIFLELQQIVLKTVGVVDPIGDALAPYRSLITCAFVYGSVAKGQETSKSDIDLMIIGQGLGYSEIFAALRSAEKTLARPINPNLSTPGEWQQRIKDRSGFTTNVLNQPKLFIFGTENDLGATG